MSVGRLIGAFGEALADLLLPELCLLCASPEPGPWPRRLCRRCLGELGLCDPASSCPVCGLPAAMATFGRRRCLACRRRRPPWAGLVVLGPYQGGLGRLLRRLKYEPLRAAALPLADLLAAYAASLRAAGELVDVDLILPVPLARDRLLRRGFNQATALAAGLPQVLGAPLRPGWARRVDLVHQVGRGRAARRRLAASAFQIDARVMGRRVLMVDDVITTGATLTAFAGALRAAGARELRALAAARTA
ncbi:MAG: hypothetical protein H6807_11610 [Planctomycetes bacterium]|nr:hypothetical protein [Planctomycetota bacterium]